MWISCDWGLLKKVFGVCRILNEKSCPKSQCFEWWPIFFFSHNLFIKSVLAIGTLYSLIFSFFKVVYGIVFGVTPDIKIISFGVKTAKNRRVTPNGEAIKDEKRNFQGRREIIYCKRAILSLSSTKILTPIPLCTPRLCWGGGHTRQAERGMGGGVNILEDERHSNALLQ